MIAKKPSNGRLIVKMVNNEQKTASGLIIADSFESTTQRTEVIAVGECKGKFIPGEFAYIQKHAGIDIGFNELIISEEHVLYTVEQ